MGPQAKRLWKDIGEACEWERPRAPSVRILWDSRATEAVLVFLRTTRAGCIGAERVPPEDRGEISEGEGGGPGPSLECIFPSFFLCSSFLSVRLRGSGGFSFVSGFVHFLLARRRPYFGWLCWSVVEAMVKKSPPPLLRPSGPHVAG